VDPIDILKGLVFAHIGFLAILTACTVWVYANVTTLKRKIHIGLMIAAFWGLTLLIMEAVITPGIYWPMSTPAQKDVAFLHPRMAVCLLSFVLADIALVVLTTERWRQELTVVNRLDAIKHKLDRLLAKADLTGDNRKA
jgi:uncharacterized membrane protein